MRDALLKTRVYSVFVSIYQRVCSDTNERLVNKGYNVTSVLRLLSVLIAFYARRQRIKKRGVQRPL